LLVLKEKKREGTQHHVHYESQATGEKKVAAEKRGVNPNLLAGGTYDLAGRTKSVLRERMPVKKAEKRGEKNNNSCGFFEEYRG